MTRFNISDHLTTQLLRQDTSMSTCIPVDERVAITIWWLENITSYCGVMEKFGFGAFTPEKIVIKVCLAMELNLLQCMVYLSDFKKGFFPLRKLSY